MNPSLRALKALLWIVALSHLAIGAGAYLSPDFQNQMALLYGAQVTWTGELSYVARMLGAFMVGLGVAGIAAARDPIRNAGLVVGFAAILLLRSTQRVVHMAAVQEMFAVPTWRIWANAVVFGFLGLALLFLLAAAARRPTAPVAEEPGPEAPATDFEL